MTHLFDYREGIVGNIDENMDESFACIRKKLLGEFDIAESSKVLKCGTKTGDTREPVKVFLRIKPLTRKEIEAGESQGCLQIENLNTVSLHPPKTSFTFKHQSRSTITGETIRRYTFSHVFGPETNQRKFFEDTSLDVVKDFINGQNCLVFSYGITNAGKTYTILGNSQNLGVLPRTINILFNSFKNQNYERTNLKPKMFCEVMKLSSIQEEFEESRKKMLLSLNDVSTYQYHQSISGTDLSLQDSTQEQYSQEDTIDLSSLLDVTSVDVDDQGPIQFCLWISFAEIYNEYIYDLLEPISMNKDRKRTVLKVGDDRKGNPYIKGLTEIHVNNADEALKLLKIGRKNQKIASTKLNENSSRSHCIFTLKILRVMNTKEPHVARVSRLSFVDLAGSERYAKTQNTGVRLKEAGNINTSIMTLGKCVELLRYNQNHANNQKNIPFRESKLTRLFQGFFCGKGKASMIVNVNQCASSFDETLHALKFSAIAKKVTTVVQGPQLAEITNHFQPPARSTRSSVAWADGSLSTPVGNKVQLAAKSDELDDADVKENEMEAAPSNVNQDYQKIITLLREQLIEERKEKALAEMKIREEVCQEMAEQLVEIEKNYNDRIVEEQRATEELYEKRMDILTKSVKKARKRPRMERVEDDDDEWVSSVLLHKEQVKNKEMSERVSELEEQLEIAEERAREAEKEKKQGSSKEVISVDQEAQVETQSNELREIKTENERLINEIRCRDEKIKSSEMNLLRLEGLEAKEIELTETVERRNKTIKDLEEEVARLEQDKGSVIKDMKKTLESRDENIEILEKKRADMEAKVIDSEGVVEQSKQRIVELEQEICSLKENNKEITKGLTEVTPEHGTMKENETIVDMEDKIKNLKEENNMEVFDLKKEIEQRNEKILLLEEMIAKNEKQMDDNIKDLEAKDCEISRLGEKAERLEASKMEEGQSLRKELKCLDEQVEQLEKSLKDCKVELDEKITQLMAVKKVQGGRSPTPTKSGQNILVKQLEKRIQESTKALEKKNSQLISKNNAVAKLETSLKELRADLSQKEQELSQLKVKFELLNESKGQEDDKDVTINDLSAQLKEQQCSLLNKSKEKEEVEENLKFVEGELEILNGKEKENQEEMMKK